MLVLDNFAANETHFNPEEAINEVIDVCAVELKLRNIEICLQKKSFLYANDIILDGDRVS